MVEKQMKLDDAIRHAKRLRAVVHPNVGFLQQLREYNRELARAKREEKKKSNKEKKRQKKTDKKPERTPDKKSKKQENDFDDIESEEFEAGTKPAE